MSVTYKADPPLPEAEAMLRAYIELMTMATAIGRFLPNMEPLDVPPSNIKLSRNDDGNVTAIKLEPTS